ncbi:MAG: flavodoxin domain-containing protein [Bacteroidales bacterium]|nr:flavodoxin domain-containing protein [Bacteroidales bacterium]
MKALVIYYSKKGTTRQFAYEIDKYLKNSNLDSRIISIYDVHTDDIKQADIVLIGCWTNGLFLFLQHPDNIWKKYAKQFPELKDKKVGFFTTYLLATGSMFSQMQRVLKEKLSGTVTLKLKSKNGKLSEDNKNLIKQFLS